MSEPLLKRLVLNTGSVYLFELVSTLLSFVSIPVIVGAVGEEQYGILVLVGGLVGYFSLLKLGIPQGTTKYIAQYKAVDDHRQIRKIIDTSIATFLVAGGILTLSLLIFLGVDGLSLFNVSENNYATAENILLISALTSLVSWPANVLGASLKGFEKFVNENLYNGIGTTVGYGAAIIMALLGYSLEIIFLCYFFGNLIKWVLEFRYLKRLVESWHLKMFGFEKATFKMIFSYSFWMLINQISNLLVYQTDRIILGVLLPVSSLTVYRVVTAPFELIKRLSSYFNSTIAPAVSAEESEKGRSSIQKFIYEGSRYSNAFVSILAIGGFYLSPPFIRLWMGESYVEYAWIAQVACIFQLLRQANSFLGHVFYGTGEVKTITVLGFIGALLNVPLGIWLVKEIGVAGVVFSTIFAAVLVVPLQYIFAFPDLQINRWRYTWSGILKGQWTSWGLGLMFLIIYQSLYNINTWPILLMAIVGMGTILLVPIYIFSIEDRHKRKIKGLFKEALKNPRQFFSN